MIALAVVKRASPKRRLADRAEPAVQAGVIDSPERVVPISAQRALGQRRLVGGAGAGDAEARLRAGVADCARVLVRGTSCAFLVRVCEDVAWVVAPMSAAGARKTTKTGLAHACLLPVTGEV